MQITWEDRKGRGLIDGAEITEKPKLSFDYAWFKVVDGFGQYVESHDHGYWNKDLTLDQVQEIVDYYYIHTAEKPNPSSNLKIVVMTGSERDENGKLCPIWGEEDRFSDIVGGPTKADQETEYISEIESKSQSALKKECEYAIERLIQSKVDDYNKANQLTITDVKSCALYAQIEGYTHKPFCAAVWAWNVQVWESARSILSQALAGEVSISSPNDVLALLPEFAFDG